MLNKKPKDFCLGGGDTVVNKNSECTECGKEGVKVVRITAELNAGEQYTVEICRECLLDYAKVLE